MDLSIPITSNISLSPIFHFSTRTFHNSSSLLYPKSAKAKDIIQKVETGENKRRNYDLGKPILLTQQELCILNFSRNAPSWPRVGVQITSPADENRHWYIIFPPGNPIEYYLSHSTESIERMSKKIQIFKQLSLSMQNELRLYPSPNDTQKEELNGPSQLSTIWEKSSDDQTQSGFNPCPNNPSESSATDPVLNKVGIDQKNEEINKRRLGNLEETIPSDVPIIHLDENSILDDENIVESTLGHKESSNKRLEHEKGLKKESETKSMYHEKELSAHYPNPSTHSLSSSMSNSPSHPPNEQSNVPKLVWAIYTELMPVPKPGPKSESEKVTDPSLFLGVIHTQSDAKELVQRTIVAVRRAIFYPKIDCVSVPVPRVGPISNYIYLENTDPSELNKMFHDQMVPNPREKAPEFSSPSTITMTSSKKEAKVSKKNAGKSSNSIKDQNQLSGLSHLKETFNPSSSNLSDPSSSIKSKEGLNTIEDDPIHKEGLKTIGNGPIHEGLKTIDQDFVLENEKNKIHLSLNLTHSISSPSSPPNDDCSPRLLALLNEIHTIFREVQQYDVALSSILRSMNFSPTSILDASHLLDQIVFLLNGTDELLFFYKELLFYSNLVVRARLILYLVKSAHGKDLLSPTGEEKLACQRAVFSQISSRLASSTNQIQSHYQSKLSQLPHHLVDAVMVHIRKMGSQSSGIDASATRKLLDFIFELPWNHLTNEQLHIPTARKILDEEHYGMEKVKSRIIEMLVIYQLTGKFSAGKVLCLVGPPGTGKTTIAESISKSLGRKFGQISVGGLWDISDLKGHRHSYFGAMPGQVIKTYHRLSTQNPVILLDEVDKLATGSQVMIALLEMLDPSQNTQFTDTWLDIPFDLSETLFICTANDESLIHPALKDRLEIIHLPGYLDEEKAQIARRHLLPKALKKAGFLSVQFIITDAAIRALIKNYSPITPGVRNLGRLIQSMVNQCSLILCQKEAEEIGAVFQEEELKTVDKDWTNSLEKSSILSQFECELYPLIDTHYDTIPKLDPKYNPGAIGREEWIENNLKDKKLKKNLSHRFYLTVLNYESYLPKNEFARYQCDLHASIPGSIVSLTTVFQPIECLAYPLSNLLNQQPLLTTGNLDQVMQESASISYTFVKNLYAQWMACEKIGKPGKLMKSGWDPLFFINHRIHIHLPRGGNDKQGTHAGSGFALALLSLALKKTIPRHWAITGELTLLGLIFPVSQLSHKVYLAQLNQIKHVILSEKNRDHWDELPATLKKSVQPHFVQWFHEIPELFWQIKVPSYASIERSLDEKQTELSLQRSVKN